MQPANKIKWGKIFWVLLLLAAAGITTGYFLWNKPHQNVATAKAKQLTATELYRTFSTDSVLANKQYLQQVLIVKGALKETITNQQQQVVAKLMTGTEGAFINCSFEGKTTELKTGDTITLCHGLG